MNNRQDELNLQIRAQVRRITAAEMAGLSGETMIALKRRLRLLKEEYKAAATPVTMGQRLMPGCTCGAADSGNFESCRCD